ncbi:uncharacterized protein J7T54_003849 [Emericellopsis cladophorae]|uniref:Zn(2)-C6 fungal-type domain-containing protein n=1 Tax=Emericellopsis cladophorae TaxID=2686198 RepID=A0A9P9XWI2_9HYPO|nr:uncharacterized protein J7T54_003849 [Emericellopsis cladophorae]KAI6778913.1 hypothetical protein J7T54_003849 [Emericellopsis cladophorae]
MVKTKGQGQPGGNAPKRTPNKKVRTGCKTFKIRRIRCDEARPTCNKCTSTGRMLLNLSYWKYLPGRLDNSQALRASLVVFCNSWLNYKTGLPPSQLIEPKLYGLAIRSLQAAIDGPEQLKVEILASIVILHRVETLLDLIRGSHVTNHAKGLIGLLQKKGYPNFDDPLETHLIVDMQAAMVSHWLVHRDVNFMHHSGWSDVFKRCAVVVAAAGDDGGLNMAPFHEFDRALGSRAEICHGVRGIHNIADREAAKIEAARKEDEIQQMLDEVRESFQPRIEYMRANGGIEQVATPTSPSGYAYDFPTDK